MQRRGHIPLPHGDPRRVLREVPCVRPPRHARDSAAQGAGGDQSRHGWLLLTYAKPGWRILDTHLGSGSIAIACHYAGHALTACEIDRDYYEAALQRIKRETAQMTLLDTPNAGVNSVAVGDPATERSKSERLVRLV